MQYCPLTVQLINPNFDPPLDSSDSGSGGTATGVIAGIVLGVLSLIVVGKIISNSQSNIGSESNEDKGKNKGGEMIEIPKLVALESPPPRPGPYFPSLDPMGPPKVAGLPDPTNPNNP